MMNPALVCYLSGALVLSISDYINDDFYNLKSIIRTLAWPVMLPVELWRKMNRG